MTDYTPTIAGFTAFIRYNMGITTAQLPDDSPTIPVAFNVAIAIVNPQLAQLGGGQCFDPALPPSGSIIYQLAVYNLAGSNVINYAQDPVPTVPYPPGSTVQPPEGFFTYTRRVWNIYGFVPGVIQSSSDESTSQSFVVQDAAKDFTLANLQSLKDPWGRQYLAFAQTLGPGAWGVS